MLSDIDYKGSDALHVYNSQQIKHRLITNGLYIACKKPRGFTINIKNNDNAMVITGIRILLGVKEITKSPQYITFCNRKIQFNLFQPRWFDIPLFKEESFHSSKELILDIGSSTHDEHETIIDSIRVYGLTKEAFGWPNDLNEKSGFDKVNNSNAFSSSYYINEYEQNHLKPNMFKEIFAQLLEILAIILPAIEDKIIIKLELVKNLMAFLTLPLPCVLQSQLDKAMCTIFKLEQDYLSFRQEIIFDFIENKLDICLQDKSNTDPELFYNIIFLIHRTLAKKNLLAQPLVKISLVFKLYSLARQLYQVTCSEKFPHQALRTGLIHTKFIFYVLVEVLFYGGMTEKYAVSTYTEILFQCLVKYDCQIRYIVKHTLMKLLKCNINLNCQNVEDLEIEHTRKIR